MISRKILLHILLVLAVLSLSPKEVVAQPPQPTEDPQQSTVPGEGDIAIMQKEIKWGMQEMQRYKSIRGAWPVRVHDDDVRDEKHDTTATTKQQKKNEKLNQQLDLIRNNNNNNSGETQSVRGAVKPESPSVHHSYWNLLVSVF